MSAIHRVISWEVNTNGRQFVILCFESGNNYRIIYLIGEMRDKYRQIWEEFWEELNRFLGYDVGSNRSYEVGKRIA